MPGKPIDLGEGLETTEDSGLGTSDSQRVPISVLQSKSERPRPRCFAM
jgi:hypothetical protein